MHLLIGADVYFINTRKARRQLIDCWREQLLKSFLQTNIWKTPEGIGGIIIFSIWIDFLIPYNYSRKQRECVESVKNPRKTQLFSTLEISKTDSLIWLCCCLTGAAGIGDRVNEVAESRPRCSDLLMLLGGWAAQTQTCRHKLVVSDNTSSDLRVWDHEQITSYIR